MLRHISDWDTDIEMGYTPIILTILDRCIVDRMVFRVKSKLSSQVPEKAAAKWLWLYISESARANWI